MGGGALAFPRASAVATAATTADLAVSASTTTPATPASGAADVDALTMVAAVWLNTEHEEACYLVGLFGVRVATARVIIWVATATCLGDFLESPGYSSFTYCNEYLYRSDRSNQHFFPTLAHFLV